MHPKVFALRSIGFLLRAFGYNWSNQTKLMVVICACKGLFWVTASERMALCQTQDIRFGFRMKDTTMIWRDVNPPCDTSWSGILACGIVRSLRESFCGIFEGIMAKYPAGEN